MSLTLEVEQRLEKATLVALFTDHEADWRAAAQNAVDFIRSNFPAGSTIRPDDVAKALKPVIEVNERLKKRLLDKKLTQKYWVSDFADLIIERAWDIIKP